MNDIKKDLQYYKLIKQEIINHERSFDKNTLPRVERVIEILKKQLNGGWIPVSERLPSEEECNKFDIMHPNRRRFLCTIKIGEYEPQVRELYFNLFYQWEYYSDIFDEYVLAWQSLPEPWKEVEHEKNS